MSQCLIKKRCVQMSQKLPLGFREKKDYVCKDCKYRNYGKCSINAVNLYLDVANNTCGSYKVCEEK